MNNHTFKLTRSEFFLFPIVVFGVSGFFLSLLVDNLLVSLLVFSFLSFIVFTTQNDKQFTNPSSTFALFFYLYSTWHVYHSLSLNGLIYDPLLNKSILLSILSLVSFLFSSFVVGVMTCRKKLNAENKSIYNVNAHPKQWSLNLITTASLLVVLLALAFALVGGYQSKRDVLESGNILLTLSGYIVYLVTAGLSLTLLNKIFSGGESFSKAILDKKIILIYISLLLGMLVLGERDFVFRAVFLTVAIYGMATKSLSSLKILVVVALFIVALPLSSLSKAYFITNVSLSDVSYSLDVIFSSEFNSASRNLYMLLSFGVEHKFSTFFNDVIRALVPFGSDLGFQSTAAWYNSYYRVVHGFSGVAGWGFSLVGQGYVMGGYFGVIFLFFFVSLVINFLYILRHRSHYWSVFYLFALAALIYSIRADLANFLSQGLKIGGGAVLCYYFASNVFKKRRWL